MRAIIESVAARAATGWQRAGAKFDFEVFAMPGGSVLAPALWMYSMMKSALQPPQSQPAEEQPASVARGERAHCSAGAHCR
jgi:hypothetical protein